MCPFCGELGPRLIQYGLGRGLLPYQLVSSSIQPFGHNRHEPKTGDCAPIGGAATPSNTTSPGLRFTSVPSGIMGGVGVPFFGDSWVHIEHKVAYLHTKWHLSPSSRLATTDIGRKLGGVPL